MLKKILQILFERVIKEHPPFGSVKIVLIFHADRFESFNFKINKKNLVKESCKFEKGLAKTGSKRDLWKAVKDTCMENDDED